MTAILVQVFISTNACYNLVMDEQIRLKLEDFFSTYKKQTYKKGEILVRADDDPSGVFYLTNGHVRMYLISVKGDEIVLNIFKPISFFPMSWAINNIKNTYYYEAMNEVTLWRAPKEDVLVFLKDNPDILYNLLSRVYRGVDGMLTRMAYLMSSNAYARLITELLITAKRFGTTSEGYEITFAISEKELGAQAGLTRETVSREMKVLKDKGLVTLQRSLLTIKDIRLLEKELTVF
jgi:CRP-like cAMP-binding protein